MNRWWIYQKERFPVMAHGPLIFAFSLCALCYSSLLRSDSQWPSFHAVSVAFVSSFISFLHLRIADEFKDYEEDLKFRPYRPVPRGLVTLRELRNLWIVTGLLQFLLAISLEPWLAAPLSLTWVYLALMSREFFVRAWITKRPITYMWTHMLILPLIDFYATACDWLVAGEKPMWGLFIFVLVSFFNGFVIEIGRKIRAPEDEEMGVQTYTFLWGTRAAPLVWFCFVLVTALLGVYAGHLIGQWTLTSVFLGAGTLLAFLAATHMTQRPTRTNSRRIEVLSGLWTLLLYASMGVIPFFILKSS